MSSPSSTILRPACAIALLALALTGFATAQTARTGAGTGGGFDISGREKNLKPREPKIIKITALTPERLWRNADGRPLTARLVAHDRPESEKDKPIVVVKEGKVRFLKDEKIFDVLLTSLCLEDQAYIEELIFAIQEAEEREAAANAKAEAEKKSSE